MTTEEKLELLADAMDLDVGDISIDSALDSFEEWDSLSKLSLIASAKKELGISLTAEKINSFVTIKDIIDFLK